jgi:hypothetical protein
MAAGEIARGLAIAGVTGLVVVAAILTVTLLLLFRRRAGAQPSGATGLEEMRTRANIALVRADEAVSAADAELGFAIAQFGEERTAHYAAALARARGELAEAFRLQQALDDTMPESVQRRREWVLQIAALCDGVIGRLESLEHDFTDLRGREADSPARIGDLRGRSARTRARLASGGTTLDRLLGEFEPALIAREHTAIADADAALNSADAAIDAAEARVSRGGANAVDDMLRAAEQSIVRADTRLGAVEARAQQLAAAASALESLLESSSVDLVEARRQRDSSADPDGAAAVVEAIARVEETRSLASTPQARRDPVRAIDELSAAVASLDTALASARNEAQRLEHARTALVGTMASASAQIADLQHLITAEGRRVGVDARTRLAEAERQLALARITTDPLEALSTARRAATLARDGDALAHYDTMTRGG